MAGLGAVVARVQALLTRAPVSVRTAVAMAGLQPEDRVLEVGCGAGDGVELAARRVGAEQVAAVEPARRYVEIVSIRVPGADVRHGSAEHVPFDDGSFSVIFSVDSMHHWRDRDLGLATVVRKLAPGGRLLIAERSIVAGGHGIRPHQVEEVLVTLRRLGQTEVRAEERRVGKRPTTFISSRAAGQDAAPELLSSPTTRRTRAPS